jgi:tRNA(Ile)-lysidine synthase
VSKLDTEVERFVKHKNARRLLVALSGGVDSVSLLHKLCELRTHYDLSVAALHVDHQIQPESEQWMKHCQAQCDELKVPLKTVKLNLQDSGHGQEAAARQARYDWFHSQITPADVLVLAHHMGDQIETVLLRLFRGSGLLGLGAMHEIRQFGLGWMARPLLGVSKEEIIAYARKKDLRYIEDPSNLDTYIDRNFVRHEVLPLIRLRWPSVDQTIFRSSDHLKTIQSSLDKGAQVDLKMFLCLSKPTLLGDSGCIRIGDLINLDQTRIVDVLRYWIRCEGLTLPSTGKMNELMRQVFGNETMGRGGIRWKEGEFRAYRGFLYLLPVQPKLCNPATQHWQGLDAVSIKEVGVALSVCRRRGSGIRVSFIKNAPFILDWQHRARVIRPSRSHHNRTIKNLFQESGIPSWERCRLPYVYLGDDLVCIPGLAVEKAYAASGTEIGLEITISGTQTGHLD